MIRIGITGQAGFLGTHLYNFFGLFKDQVERIQFHDNYFDNSQTLDSFVASCDVIIHLAALNRHNDPQQIFDTNILLVDKLIQSLKRTNSKPYVLFASSIQEERDNPFGKSKLQGRKMLEAWAVENNARFTGLIIPNVFGPFGKPYYNSVVATFSHQLIIGEEPKIEIDATLPLIFVGDLCHEIFKLIIAEPKNNPEIRIAHTIQISVTEILSKLKIYRNEYLLGKRIPLLKDKFDINLFNTFRSFIDCSKFNPGLLTQNTDNRGSFVETIRTEIGGQFSFSSTHSGITRGNHFHTRKIERFIVIQGEAEICLRKIGSDEVHSFSLSGTNPAFVDMPIWYTHNITNVGDSELLTLFWINEPFDPADPDTFFESI